MKDHNLTNQVYYQGRWVDKQHFRVFVYNGDKNKLVESYEEYLNAIESGEWFEMPGQQKKVRKPKNGADG